MYIFSTRYNYIFLSDDITIRFTLSDITGHYNVYFLIHFLAYLECGRKFKFGFEIEFELNLF